MCVGGFLARHENEITDVMLRHAGKSGEEKTKNFFEKQLTTGMKLCYNKSSKESEGK